jgi:ABC-type transport system involved in cytochrome c biogenesis permease component
MTNEGMRRSLVPGIVLKVGFPLLIGLVTLVSAEAGGMQGRDSLVLTAVVTLGSALILFMVDTEIRISAVDERMTAAGRSPLARRWRLTATG